MILSPGLEWCGGKWLRLNDEERYSEIITKAKELKPEVLMNVCRCKFPGEELAETAYSWRISKDIKARFSSILKIIDLNAELSKYCGPGHYNDMDMLQVGRGMSYEENQTHFSMWAKMHSPMLLSCES